MGRNCEHCGKPIPAGRLEALPHTKTCVACSDERERLDVEPDGMDPRDLQRVGFTPERDG